ncbi:MAG: hypothetical protein HW397_420 [Dehalococcoidia bacterium]|nr:hypothetical protein [Dehalococcoidia bacterium]
MPLPDNKMLFFVSLIAAVFAATLVACSAPPPTPIPTPTPVPTPTATPEGAPIPVVLPRDDAPHPEYNTEWWYYNAHLVDSTGQRYSLHYVVFDVRYPGITPINIYHAAITDEQTKAFVIGQRSVASGINLAPNAAFAYQSEGWIVGGREGKDHLAAQLGAYSFDLDLLQTKPAALHGGIGHLQFTPTDKTYYYSRTRMDASGILTRDGQDLQVTGTAWFDHQWGNFRLQYAGGGWDWFALQLDDGRDLMVFQLMDAQKRVFHTFATVIDKMGATRDLEDADIKVTATGSWTSSASGGVYPMGWRLELKEASIDVTLTPVMEDAEFNATSTTFSRYWEGPVTVTGSQTGRGFVEMVGYAPFRLPSR